MMTEEGKEMRGMTKKEDKKTEKASNQQRQTDITVWMTTTCEESLAILAMFNDFFPFVIQRIFQIWISDQRYTHISR